MSSLDTIATEIREASERREEERKKWNERCPPTVETLAHLYPDCLPETIGIWVVPDKGIRWGIRYSNGYNPHDLQFISSSLLTALYTALKQ